MTTYQLFDDLAPAVESALRASIDRFGVLVPVVVDQHGQVLDGHHRKRIADDLDVDYRVDVVTVADESEAREIARTLNADRRQLTPEQRREVVAELRSQGHSYRAIGDALGVSHPTVMADVKATGKPLPVEPERVVGLDGKSRPATKSRLDPEPVAPVAAPEQSPKLAPLMSSDSPEWYTPESVVKLATDVLGGIDLDPCSNAVGEPNVDAANHYTYHDDGLSRQWHGTIYMNPPYGRGIDSWVGYLLGEFEAGRCTAAVALVPARTDTQWFRILRDWPVCFVEGRLRFISPDGESDPAPFPSAAFYLGTEPDRFTKAFSTLGDVYERVSA